jgi:hypothetical protein
MLFVIFYLFQAGLHGYLKEHASGEYVKLMTKPKYSEMKQSLKNWLKQNRLMAVI